MQEPCQRAAMPKIERNQAGQQGGKQIRPAFRL